jgi:hypothetical protein
MRTEPSGDGPAHPVTAAAVCRVQRLVTGPWDEILGEMETNSGRSLARMEMEDLLRLAALAAEVEAGLFTRNPGGAGRYAGRLICRALCQGAALHYLDGKNGVKDFDAWSFYAQRGDGPFPYRWRGTADYGPSRFGRYPGDPSSFTGRRVDLLGRSLDVPAGADPVSALRKYLFAARTASAKALAAKAVVLIHPGRLAGTVVWPPGSSG